jgi:outer membrane receptor for ferric coprogen and ferric-rhodotorulic acid
VQAGRYIFSYLGEVDMNVNAKLALSAAIAMVLWAAPEPLAAQATDDDGDVTVLDTITLWGTSQTGTAVTEGTGSYTTTEMNTAAGVALTGRETPQSTSVITRQQLDDLAVTEMEDALRRTTGVTVMRDSGRYRFQSRGFYIDQIQEDGVNSPAPGSSVNPYRTSSSMSDLEIYDHIEVVRGATGLVQANGEPGGTINAVRKRPTRDFQGSTGLTFGSDSHYRGTIDFSGPLNEQGSLRGRIVAVHDEQDSFKDNVDSRNDIVYGVLDYDIAPDTTLTFGAVWQERRDTPDLFGLPRGTGGADLGLARSTYLGANWNSDDFEKQEAFAELNHRFDDDWSLSTRLSYQHSDSSQSFAALGNGSTSYVGVGTDGLLNVNNMQRYDNDSDQIGFHVTATGRYYLFGRRHDVFFGLNYSREKINSRWRRHMDSTSYNIWTFDGGIPQPDWNDSTILQNDVSYHYKLTQKAVNFGTRLDVSDPVKVILGGRYTDFRLSGDYQYTTWAGSPDSEYGPLDSVSKKKFVPYAGITYEVTPEVSVYASYTSIFKPQTSADAAGNVLDPVVGENYEIGAKAELFGGLANASVALFNIDQENRAIWNATASAYEAEGKVRSRGIDVELAGEVATGWNLFAGYTYNKTKYLETESTSALSGATYSPQTPRHLLRLHSTYNLPVDGNRWTVGGGVQIQSDATSIYGVHYPGFAVWDASLAYQLAEKARLQLVVNNLFDKTYYESSRNGTNGMNNFYGAPRYAALTLKMDF